MSIILVDCDDVLTNTCELWIKALNIIYDNDYSIEHMSDWDFRCLYPNTPFKDIVKPIMTEAFWMNVKPKEGAVEYTKKLIDEGNEVYICTATYHENVEWKYKYIFERYFPFIDENHIIICHNKKLINADYLIDDNPLNLFNGNYIGLLFDMPHNRACYMSDNMHRINSWKDCYNFINSRSK